jgi:2-polyprenyl-6-hydroxyphenyl methylase/3-demethylubiquinone-9 3-methyltransferase
VELDFGEQFKNIHDAIVSYLPKSDRAPVVLEVGCGPGYLSLELARAGLDVTGLDLSPKCIEVAERFADNDPFKAERGSLRYMVGDFFSHSALPEGGFDVIVFLGALHHFSDQGATLDRVQKLLRPNGLVLAHEPVRDRVTRGNAVFVHLLRVLLSAQGSFYKHYEVPKDASVHEKELENLFAEMRYETEDGENVQSVNDNEAGYADMRPALDKRFDLVQFDWRYSFFHEFIGGLRFDERRNELLARYLRDVDGELCRLGNLSPTEFFYVGRKRPEQ